METLIGLLVPITFLSLLCIEPFLTGRPQPKVRGWIPKALVFFAVGGFLNATVPAVVAKVLERHTPLNLSGLGTPVGAVLALLGTTLLAYWFHRLEHRSKFLWRAAHQMHHAAERVDIAGFAYNHPLDLALGMALGAVPAAVLGVSPSAALIAGLIAAGLDMFSHFNIKTPTWLGFLIQRPEAHSVHHQREVHAYNYGLPLWDLAFGTFRNPAVWNAKAGFWDGASSRTFALLVGCDLSTPPAEQRARPGITANAA